jgi:hypothetical protein
MHKYLSKDNIQDSIPYNNKIKFLRIVIRTIRETIGSLFLSFVQDDKVKIHRKSHERTTNHY